MLRPARTATARCSQGAAAARAWWEIRESDRKRLITLVAISDHALWRQAAAAGAFVAIVVRVLRPALRRPDLPLLGAGCFRISAVPSESPTVRLNRAIGYITPKNMLAGHQQEIQAERDRKLEAARQPRQSRRRQAA